MLTNFHCAHTALAKYTKGLEEPSFDVSKHIKVVSIGEPAEDAGGPLLEFLTHSGRVVNLVDYVHAYTPWSSCDDGDWGKKARASDFDRVDSSFCQGCKRCCYASRVVPWQQRALESKESHFENEGVFEQFSRMNLKR